MFDPLTSDGMTPSGSLPGVFNSKTASLPPLPDNGTATRSEFAGMEYDL